MGVASTWSSWPGSSGGRWRKLAMDLVEPAYLEKFSVDQRVKLFEFIDRAHQILGDCFFDRYDTRMDAGIVALALRAALIFGYENNRLAELFRDEFGVGGVTVDLLGEWLAALDLVDVEKRIMAAAGGRN